jgi:hypothetical protein
MRTAVHSQWEAAPHAFCLFLSNLSLIFEGAMVFLGDIAYSTYLLVYKNALLFHKKLSSLLKSHAGSKSKMGYKWKNVWIPQSP